VQDPDGARNQRYGGKIGEKRARINESEKRQLPCDAFPTTSAGKHIRNQMLPTGASDPVFKECDELCRIIAVCRRTAERNSGRIKN
jgi:hypothetical protein